MKEGKIFVKMVHSFEPNRNPSYSGVPLFLRVDCRSWLLVYTHTPEEPGRSESLRRSTDVSILTRVLSSQRSKSLIFTHLFTRKVYFSILKKKSHSYKVRYKPRINMSVNRQKIDFTLRLTHRIQNKTLRYPLWSSSWRVDSI